jgi:hypothetical protein
MTTPGTEGPDRSGAAPGEAPPAPATSGSFGFPDDIDRLYARLSPVPTPRGFVAAVLQQVAAQRTVRLSWAWLAAGVVCLCTVLLLGFLAGEAMVGSGLIALLTTLAADLDAFGEAPGAALLGLLDAVPWLELAGVALALIASARLLRHVTARGGA